MQEIDIQTVSVSSLWGLWSSWCSMETQTVCVYFYSSGANQNHFLDSVWCTLFIDLKLLSGKKKSLESPTTCSSWHHDCRLSQQQDHISLFQQTTDQKSFQQKRRQSGARWAKSLKTKVLLGKIARLLSAISTLHFCCSKDTTFQL